MKKKIAVVFLRMVVGGAEKALIEFLKNIDTSRYDVTLFTFSDNGGVVAQLPESINIAYVGQNHTESLLMEDLKRFRTGRFLKGMLLRARIRMTRDPYEQFALTILTYPKIRERFDCAIAYKLGYEDTAMLLSQIDADRKCAWVHGTVNGNRKEKKLYRHLGTVSKIFCVSEYARQRVNALYPQVAHKTAVFYNLMDAPGILKQAALPMDCKYRKTAVVTVGRLCAVKGQQMVPKALRLLLDAGYDLYWYLVGDGPLREEIERESEKYGVRDRVMLLGTKQNPYPYIKNCDIYVQPSFSEGYCTTTMEAKILQMPIVTTDAPGMREQFVSGENGLIVDAMTPEALARGIRTLLDDPALMEKFRSALKLESHDHTKELQKLYDFIES